MHAAVCFILLLSGHCASFPVRFVGPDRRLSNEKFQDSNLDGKRNRIKFPAQFDLIVKPWPIISVTV